MHTGLVPSRYRKCETCGRDAAFDIVRNLCTVVGCHPMRRLQDAMKAAADPSTQELIEAERDIIDVVMKRYRNNDFIFPLNAAANYEEILRRAQSQE